VVCIIDIEIASVRQAQFVPFCIAIRDAKIDETTFRIAVNYGSMYLSDLEQLFRGNMAAQRIVKWHSIS
jgi:hypothetical protein